MSAEGLNDWTWSNAANVVGWSRLVHGLVTILTVTILTNWHWALDNLTTSRQTEQHRASTVLTVFAANLMIHEMNSSFYIGSILSHESWVMWTSGTGEVNLQVTTQLSLDLRGGQNFRTAATQSLQSLSLQELSNVNVQSLLVFVVSG